MHTICSATMLSIMQIKQPPRSTTKSHKMSISVKFDR